MPHPVYTVVIEMSSMGKRPSIIKGFSIAAPDEKTALMKAFIHAQRDNRRRIIDHHISIQPGVYW